MVKRSNEFSQVRREDYEALISNNNKETNGIDFASKDEIKKRRIISVSGNKKWSSIPKKNINASPSLSGSTNPFASIKLPDKPLNTNPFASIKLPDKPLNTNPFASIKLPDKPLNTNPFASIKLPDKPDIESPAVRTDLFKKKELIVTKTKVLSPAPSLKLRKKKIKLVKEFNSMLDDIPNKPNFSPEGDISEAAASFSSDMIRMKFCEFSTDPSSPSSDDKKPLNPITEEKDKIVPFTTFSSVNSTPKINNNELFKFPNKNTEKPITNEFAKGRREDHEALTSRNNETINGRDWASKGEMKKRRVITVSGIKKWSNIGASPSLTKATDNSTTANNSALFTSPALTSNITSAITKTSNMDKGSLSNKTGNELKITSPSNTDNNIFSEGVTVVADEGEDILFEARGIVYKTVDESWENIAKGAIRVLKHKEKGTSRIVLRNDVGNPVFNMSVPKGMVFNKKEGSKTYICFRGIVDKDTGFKNYLLKVGESHVNELYDCLNKISK